MTQQASDSDFDQAVADATAAFMKVMNLRGFQPKEGAHTKAQLGQCADFMFFAMRGGPHPNAANLVNAVRNIDLLSIAEAPQSADAPFTVISVDETTGGIHLHHVAAKDGRKKEQGAVDGCFSARPSSSWRTVGPSR